jgi:hypothetical protein
MYNKSLAKFLRFNLHYGNFYGLHVIREMMGKPRERPGLLCNKFSYLRNVRNNDSISLPSCCECTLRKSDKDLTRDSLDAIQCRA